MSSSRLSRGPVHMHDVSDSAEDTKQPTIASFAPRKGECWPTHACKACLQEAFQAFLLTDKALEHRGRVAQPSSLTLLLPMVASYWHLEAPLTARRIDEPIVQSRAPQRSHHPAGRPQLRESLALLPFPSFSFDHCHAAHDHSSIYHRNVPCLSRTLHLSSTTTSFPVLTRPYIHDLVAAPFQSLDLQARVIEAALHTFVPLIPGTRFHHKIGHNEAVDQRKRTHLKSKKAVISAIFEYRQQTRHPPCPPLIHYEWTGTIAISVPMA